jgi:hypothetical protein
MSGLPYGPYTVKNVRRAAGCPASTAVSCVASGPPSITTSMGIGSSMLTLEDRTMGVIAGAYGGLPVDKRAAQEDHGLPLCVHQGCAALPSKKFLRSGPVGLPSDGNRFVRLGCALGDSRRTCMRDFAEVSTPSVHLGAFQMRSGGAPEAEIHKCAVPASAEKLGVDRPQIAYLRNETEPCLGQTTSAEVVSAPRRTQRRTKAKPAIVTHGEAGIASAAMKQVVAGQVNLIRLDDMVALSAKCPGPLLVSLLDSGNLGRRQSLPPDFLVSPRVAVQAKVNQWIEAEVIFRPFVAETCDFWQFVHV